MSAFQPPKQARKLVEEADTYLRENPIPAIVGAVLVGVAVGMLIASVEKPARRRPTVRDFLDDFASGVHDRVDPLAKKARRAYADSSERVREAVHEATDRARHFDVEPVLGPLAAWWKRMWS